MPFVRPPKPEQPETATSPRIAALAVAVAASESGALEQFWASVEVDRTPLIEAIPAAPDERLVTFIWREPAGSATQDVFLWANAMTDISQPREFARTASRDRLLAPDLSTPRRLAGHLSMRLPLRFYLDVDLQEWIPLAVNPHLRDILEMKGYELTYRKYNGGYDYACWSGSFADGLLALCEGWS